MRRALAALAATVTLAGLAGCDPLNPKAGCTAYIVNAERQSAANAERAYQQLVSGAKPAAASPPAASC